MTYFCKKNVAYLTYFRNIILMIIMHKKYCGGRRYGSFGHVGVQKRTHIAGGVQ